MKTSYESKEIQISTTGLKSGKFSICLVIPGEPIAQSRPRFVRRGSYVSTYDSLAKEKEILRLKAKEKLPPTLPGPPLMPVHVDIAFCFSFPKSSCWDDCTNNKDLDNLEKFILDTFNGLLYQDDRQITKLSSVKYYSIFPQTIVNLEYQPMRSLDSIYEKLTPYEFYDLYILCCKIVAFYDKNRMEQALETLSPAEQEIGRELLLELLKLQPVLKRIAKESKDA